jgi:uncharacterized protein YjbI with pentapeptide repeats
MAETVETESGKRSDRPDNGRPWYEAYAERPWLAILAGVLVGAALLFVGVALGGGGKEHIVPVGALVAAVIGGGIALGQLQVARKRHEEQTKADLRRHDAQTKADFQRRITESFTKAVEQLGSEHLQVRIGGIYALERISRESDEDYWSVMEMLTAFVRERARWKKPNPADATSAEEQHEAPTDVAAVIAVLRRRRQTNREQERREGWRLDLRSTDLRGVDLSGAHFEKADLRGTHLEGARLEEAHLEMADLRRAHLERAHLKGTHLKRAALWGTHLEGADLRGAHLERTYLGDTHLKGADLGEAYLESSWGLTQDQLEETLGDAVTRLPKSLKRPDDWIPF